MFKASNKLLPDNIQLYIANHELRRNFNAVILITAVYIPPHANAKLALEGLHSSVNTQLNAYSEGVVIVAGDFNHVELKTVLPKLHKHINFPTGDNNILDQVYTNIRGLQT